MADAKITALTAHTAPISTDIVPIVDITATATKKITADAFTSSSLYRQAIINSNFDVWQRGISISMTTADAYTADRWYCETATAGTDKTVSRQDGTGVNGSYYCARVAAVQDVDALLTFSQALESQDSIKFRGKKLTLSFYAKGGAEFVADNSTLVSKIVTGKGTDQKVLAFTTTADAVSQNNTLTTGWVKFTCTTSTAIASDITQVGVSFSFTHAGSGTTTNYFDVTQVQLCAGDVTLPYQPLSYDQELRACQRYFEVMGKTMGVNVSWGIAYLADTTSAFLVFHHIEKRAVPTTVTVSGQYYCSSAAASTSTYAVTIGCETNFFVDFTFGTSNFTAGHAGYLYDAGSADSKMTIDAEL